MKQIILTSAQPDSTNFGLIEAGTRKILQPELPKSQCCIFLSPGVVKNNPDYLYLGENDDHVLLLEAIKEFKEVNRPLVIAFMGELVDELELLTNYLENELSGNEYSIEVINLSLGQNALIVTLSTDDLKSRIINIENPALK